MEGFRLGDVLGRGKFGVAFKVTRLSDGAELALKKIEFESLPEVEQKATLSEVQLLSRLRHPSIISYEDAFLEGGLLHIVMELAPGGSLEDELKHAQEAGTPLGEPRLLEELVLRLVRRRRLLDIDPLLGERPSRILAPEVALKAHGLLEPVHRIK